MFLKIIVPILAVLSFIPCMFGLIVFLIDPTKITGTFFPLGLLGIWICSKIINKWRVE